MTVTIDTMVSRWNDPKARPLFKGRLIDDSGCCCAQGDVLRCSGWTDHQLLALSQDKADVEVAKILGISRTHAILLRNINDSKDGCPQDVLANPEKILGPNARVVIAFWKQIDQLGWDDWKRATAAMAAARDARAAAWAAAMAAARAAARDAAWAAAGDAAGDAAGECVGISHLAEPFFLKFFFDDVPGWIASVK